MHMYLAQIIIQILLRDNGTARVGHWGIATPFVFDEP